MNTPNQIALYGILQPALERRPHVMQTPTRFGFETNTHAPALHGSRGSAVGEGQK